MGLMIDGQRVAYESRVKPYSASWLGDAGQFVAARNANARVPFVLWDLGGGRYALQDARDSSRSFIGSQAEVKAAILNDVATQGVLKVGIPARSSQVVRNDPSNRDFTVPPMPHQDAANQALGPNVGGADGVSLPGEMAPAQGTGNPLGSIIIIGAVAAILIFAFKK